MARTILVVEDDADIIATVEDFLVAEGYAVLSAANGREALAILDRGERPCLILLDLLMPVMDGYEFLTELRARPDVATIPVVVVSASPPIGASPGLAILKKPFGLTAFVETVRKHCPL